MVQLRSKSGEIGPCRSKKVFCGFPILHASLLQDVIGNSSKNDVTKFLSQIERNYDDIINQKDPLYGDTAMHVALAYNKFEVLKKMIRIGGDILIENNSGDSVETLLERRIQESIRRKESGIRSELLKVVQTCIEVNRNTSKAKVWREQLMHKAVRKNQVSINFTNIFQAILIKYAIHLKPFQHTQLHLIHCNSYNICNVD